MDKIGNLFSELVNLDSKTMYAVLVWGAFISIVLSTAYFLSNRKNTVRNIDGIFILSRVFQFFAYLFLFGREIISDVISVYGGNVLLFIGFYLEALSLLRVGEKNVSKKVFYPMTVILVTSIVGFCLIETLDESGTGRMRVPVASIAALAILLIPSLKLTFSRGGSIFKRIVGLLYLAFDVFMIPRAVYSYANHGINTFSSFTIQSVTYISLLLLLIVGSTAYLLLTKDEYDKVLNKMATTDFLTDIPNRASFLNAVESKFDAMRDANESVALVFLDIDNFKRINDSYGHQFGDVVLTRVGQIIMQNIRAVDFACRYGGEEFLIFVADTDKERMEAVIERLMENIRATRFREHPSFSLTASFGIMVGIPEADERLSKFIVKADEAMYVAKHSGKDKACFYEEK